MYILEKYIYSICTCFKDLYSFECASTCFFHVALLILFQFFSEITSPLLPSSVFTLWPFTKWILYGWLPRISRKATLSPSRERTEVYLVSYLPLESEQKSITWVISLLRANRSPSRELENRDILDQILTSVSSSVAFQPCNDVTKTF